MKLRALKLFVLIATTVLAGAAVASSGSASGSRDIVAAAAGYSHTCAVTPGGGLTCWGDNTSGQLGDGTTTNRLLAVDVAGLSSGVTAVTAGEAHTCALTSTGGVRCWGENSHGQLGNGTVASSSLPVDVCADAGCDQPLSAVASISAGKLHTCALTSAGGVKCWGYNEEGQLGDGTTTDSSTPVDVPSLEGGTAGVAAGAYHTCAVTVQGGATCWGRNTEGQIGDDRACGLLCFTPVDVVGLSSGVAVLAAGGLHTCALTTAGGVLCWGYNFTGQVGDGTNNNIRRAPVHVSGLGSGITFIAANGMFHGHTCALSALGALKCWGDNAGGQLGDGTTTDGLVPIDVAGLNSGVLGVAPGSRHTCAIVAPATLTCWGDNTHGQLGDGTTIARLTPTDGGGQRARAGDANCDSAVNSIDAVFILQLVAGLIRSLPCPANGDVNHDDTVNAIDATLVLQCTAGLLDCAAV